MCDGHNDGSFDDFLSDLSAALQLAAGRAGGKRTAWISETADELGMKESRFKQIVYGNAATPPPAATIARMIRLLGAEFGSDLYRHRYGVVCVSTNQSEAVRAAAILDQFSAIAPALQEIAALINKAGGK